MRNFILVLLAVATPAFARAQNTHAVADETALRSAIAAAAPGDSIVFSANITLAGGDLPSIANSITVNGAGHTLSGGDQFRGLLVAGYGGVGAPGPAPVDVTIQNLTIADTVARGGNGGSGSAGGGGGGGLGGALFVGQLANVTLNNVNFTSNSAVGGNGGAGGLAGVDAGGGGGLGGNGGNGAAGFGGGGGGAGTGADAGGLKPGGPGILSGAGPGGGSGALPGGAAGGGGAASGNGSGGGGDNGSQGGSGVGGSGGYGGGGAGGSGSSGGFGNTGGGGGGGISGGFGGFGGGGGGATSAGSEGGGGFGAGNGGDAGASGGGGGAGMGGAVFVDSGGSITITGNITMNGNTVTGGAGATGGGGGSALGSGLFFGGSGAIFFSTAAGETQTIDDSIADQLGSLGGGLLDFPSLSLIKDGAGTLILNGTNTYAGSTFIGQGTVQVGSAAALGSGFIQMSGDTTLAVTGTTTFTQNLDLAEAPTISVTAGNTATFAGALVNDIEVPTANLTIAGGGTVVLANASNTYAGGTTVIGNSTVSIAADGALGAAGTGVTLGDAATGGTISFQNTSTFGTGRAFTLGAGGGIFDTAGNADIGLTGSIGGTGSLTKTGTGTLTLSGANTYTGPTSVTAGVLRAGIGDAFAGNAAMTVAAGATLDTGVFDQTVGSLAGAGAVTVGGGALTAGGDNTSTIFSGTIDGAGALIKAGAGTLTLSGTTSHTGGTIVSGGALVGTTASLQGAIQNDALVLFDQAADGTYAGAMGGTGALAKTGAGTLTLSGTNAYSGGTVIAEGAIAVSADAGLGAASGGVTLGSAITSATLTFTNDALFSSSRSFVLGSGGGVFNTIGSSPVILSGSVTGSGGLTKTGAGILELSGSGGYAGPTTVAAGTLRASAANVFGAAGALQIGDGAIADLNGFGQTVASIGGTGGILLGGGTLTTSGGAFSGTISGTGALVKTGSGALTLTGANTYSGGTDVLGGALVGDTTSLQGQIRNNALVQFDQDFDGTYAGSMSGSGSLAKTGDGTLTLSGNNTYTGGTIIDGGSVIGSASSLQGLIVNNAQLTLGGGADATFAGTLAGTGRVTKTGTGTLTLEGPQALSGVFNVAQGTLALNGVFGGSLDVASGATVRASGIIGGSVDLAGSLFALAPPSSPSSLSTAFSGTALSSGDRLEGPSFLTIGRDLTATPGSVIDFAIAPGENPTIVVGGLASLNGTRLNVTAPAIGDARSASFLAIAALNGLSMVDSEVTTSDDGVLPLLKQDRNALFVTMVNLNVPLSSVSSPRTTTVADAIDRTKFGAEGDAAFVIRELTALDDAALGDALEQIGGQLHATVLQTAVLDTEIVNDLVRDQLQARDMEGITDVRWWGETACQHASFKGSDRARGGTSNVCTGAGGADRQLSDRWTVGGGGSFTGGGMGLGAMGSGDYTAPRAFGYVGYKPRGFGIRGGGSAAKSKYKTKRQIVFQALLPEELGGQPLTGGVDREAESEQNGVTTDSWGEIEDTRKIRTYSIEGTLGVRHARIGRGSFSETGALALSLNTAEQVIRLTQTDVRVHAWRREGSYRPFFDFNYRREFAEGDTTADVEFSGLPGSDFIVEGVGIPAHTYSGKLGITFVPLFGQATVLYEFKVAPGQRRQTAGLRMRF